MSRERGHPKGFDDSIRRPSVGFKVTNRGFRQARDKDEDNADGKESLWWEKKGDIEGLPL
jgi:hypothetical protein